MRISRGISASANSCFVLLRPPSAVLKARASATLVKEEET